MIEAPPDASSDAPRRGASRPTIVLGFGCLGGLLGMIAGAYFGGSVLGIGLPDEAEYLPFVMMIGAGAGWLAGAGLGSIAGRTARAPGALGRGLVLVGAVVVVVGAVAIVISPVPSGWPDGGVTFFSFWREGDGGAFEIAVLVGTALVLLTFLAVSRQQESASSRPPGRLVGAVGIVGLLLGGLVFLLGVWLVPLNWSDTGDHQRYRAVIRTTNSLVVAAGKYERRTGEYPSNLEDVLAAGGKVRRGAQVEFAGVVNGKFCVRVGVDLGEEAAGEPHYSALVYPRGSMLGVGNSCTDR